MQSSLKVETDHQSTASKSYSNAYYLIGIFFAVVATPAALFITYLVFLSAFGNALTPQRASDLFNDYYNHKQDIEISKNVHVIDNYVDCIALGMMNLKPDSTPRSAIQLYIDSDLAWGPNIGGCDALREFYRGNKQIQILSFDRYWHGYTVFTKTLLPFISVPALKVILTSILAISFLTWIFAVVRPFCGVPKMIVLLFSSVLSVDFIDLETAFTHKIAWVSLFLSSTVVFFASRRSLSMSLICVCIASAVAIFFDLLFVTPLIPAFMVLSVFSGNQYIKCRASFTEALQIFVVVGLLSVLSVVAMQLFRLTSTSVLSGNGLNNAHAAIDYFVHQDYGAKFSSSFHFGEVLRTAIPIFFWTKLSGFGAALFALSLIVPSHNREGVSPSKIAQMFCTIAALSPLLWFLFFPAHSLVHMGIVGYEIFYFALFLMATALPGLNFRHNIRNA